jgi:hypothetical protein
MPRPIALLLLALAAMPLTVVAAGCGSGRGPSAAEREAEGGEAAREQQQRTEAAKLVPVGDRVAYYQLTTTSGFLRPTLEVERHNAGSSATVERGELDAALKRLEQITPRDSGLRTVQRKMIPIASEALNNVSSRRAAQLLKRLDQLNADLSRFLSRRPAQAVLVPD